MGSSFHFADYAWAQAPLHVPCTTNMTAHGTPRNDNLLSLFPFLSCITKRPRLIILTTLNTTQSHATMFVTPTKLTHSLAPDTSGPHFTHANCFHFCNTEAIATIISSIRTSSLLSQDRHVHISTGTLVATCRLTYGIIINILYRGKPNIAEVSRSLSGYNVLVMFFELPTIPYLSARRPTSA